MKYLRTFKGGAADHDPRCKTWAEFKCENCGHIDCLDITANHTFNKYKPRICPKCKTYSEEDLNNNIKKEIEELTKTIETAQIKRKQLEEKLKQCSK